VCKSWNVVATPLIWKDNYIRLFNPTHCQGFQRAPRDLPNFGFKVKIIQYNNRIVPEDEISMIRFLFDKCPSLTTLVVLASAPEPVLRVLDGYEESNAFPDLQELILISISSAVLPFDNLYVSVHFKFRDTLTCLELLFIEKSEEAAANYGGLHQYISSFANLKEFYCRGLGANRTDTDISLLVKNNRRLDMIILHGFQFYYQSTAPFADSNEEEGIRKTQPAAAVRAIKLTYVELDLNTLKFIMTLASIRQLKIRPSFFASATKKTDIK
jgi:hypothetical protein